MRPIPMNCGCVVSGPSWQSMYRSQHTQAQSQPHSFIHKEVHVHNLAATWGQPPQLGCVLQQLVRGADIPCRNTTMTQQCWLGSTILLLQQTFDGSGLRPTAPNLQHSASTSHHTPHIHTGSAAPSHSTPIPRPVHSHTPGPLSHALSHTRKITVTLTVPSQPHLYLLLLRHLRVGVVRSRPELVPHPHIECQVGQAANKVSYPGLLVGHCALQ